MKKLHLTTHSTRTQTGMALVLCLALSLLPAVHAQVPAEVKDGISITLDSGLSGTGEDPLAAATFAGALKVLTAELTEQGDSLLLKMELRVDREAVNKRQSWAIVPQLISQKGDNLTQITFPYILVNGRIREQLYKRKLSFGNRELLANPPAMRTKINRGAEGSELLSYAVRIPYERWMDTAGLKLHAILISPAGKHQLLSTENAGRVRLAPRATHEAQLRLNFIEPDPGQEQGKMRRQAVLDFQVGKSVIAPTFRSNPEELSKIARMAADIRDNPDARSSGLLIEGYASPEGGYAANDRLARRRSEAFRNYMAKEYGLDRQLFRVNSVAEDWDGLRTLVTESSLTDAQKQAALSVIDSNDDPDGKEARLRAQVATWRLMNAEMFPRLRRVAYYTAREYTIEESRAMATSNPGTLSQRELFLLAMSYPESSKEREQTFDLMQRFYPGDNVSNINVAACMLSRGEPAGAKRMLDKAKDDTRAYNNLGVYYLMTGEPGKAREYLEKADAQGIEEAAHNLEEARKKEKELLF